MENRNTLFKMKTVTHIEVPKEWQITNDWNSHLPMLSLALRNSPEYTFIEFGMGNGSTPLLKRYAKYIASIEGNKEWRDKFIEGYDNLFIQYMGDEVEVYRKGNHTVFKYYDFILNWISDPNVYPNHKEIWFVDNAPAEDRIKIIKAAKKHVPVIIIHDTEESAEYVYGLKEILSTFKYRLDFKPEGLPHTTAVSNFINVEGWV